MLTIAMPPTESAAVATLHSVRAPIERPERFWAVILAGAMALVCKALVNELLATHGPSSFVISLAAAVSFPRRGHVSAELLPRNSNSSS